MRVSPGGRAPGLADQGLLGVGLVAFVLMVGCVNNPNYIALEDLPVRASDGQRDVRSGQSGRTPPQLQESADRAGARPAPTGESAENLPPIYTVERGDTLYSIAFRYSRDFRDLARENDIDPPYVIVPGQRIDTRVGQPDTADRSQPESARGTEPSAPRAEAQSSEPPGRWIWPVRGNILRSFSDGPSGSKGIDIGASAGTSIQAAADGTVVYAGDGLRGYGNLIILEHSGRMLSAYAFTDQIAVAERDQVSQGDVIAQVGTRGDTALLHFEIRSEGKPVNPLSYLPE